MREIRSSGRGARSRAESSFLGSNRGSGKPRQYQKIARNRSYPKARSMGGTRRCVHTVTTMLAALIERNRVAIIRTMLPGNTLGYRMEPPRGFLCLNLLRSIALEAFRNERCPFEKSASDDLTVLQGVLSRSLRDSRTSYQNSGRFGFLELLVLKIVEFYL